LDESHKLDSWPLDEGPRPNSGKLQLNLHRHHFAGKINRFSSFKNKCSNESSCFGEPRFKLRFKAGSISRIQFASNESNLVLRNLNPGPIQSGP
jgi:hypothetical protein